jgi:hypothetical protein
MSLGHMAAVAALVSLCTVVRPAHATVGDCRDVSTCSRIDNCTNHDAMLRAGYKCHGFPHCWGVRRANPAKVSDAPPVGRAGKRGWGRGERG